MIAVTQPRRVAAISLARRVAEEMGTPCGAASPASKVGYSVRFDDSTSPSTRIKFVTEGILLQEMLKDAALRDYSCIIVDEVHERSVNVDLILGFLKNLLLDRAKRKSPLKVVVMSATADVDSIAQFFAERRAPGIDNAAVPSKITTSICRVEGRQYPVDTIYLDKPSTSISETLLQRIFQIHCKEALPGDILVFMTGQETIQSLQKSVEEHAKGLPHDVPMLQVLPLFAALPLSAQQDVFLPPPHYTRKVILSTNIAETSITVPGVRYVIDSGKSKVRQFRSGIGLSSLLPGPISKSSADQRKGRAGREAAGKCFRLYPEDIYHSLPDADPPEILRCDLDQAVLNLKARGVDDILNFPFMTPPSRKSIEDALLQLLSLGTLDTSGRISDIGSKIARLPLNPSLGRALIAAAQPELNCLPHVVDIVSALSVENIFFNVSTDEDRESASQARQQLVRRQGDHLTLLAAVQGYAAETADRRRWAEDHSISHRTMQNVMKVGKQLQAQCKAAKLLPKGATDFEEVVAISSATAISENLHENILKAFLAGFWTNVARLCPDGSYKTVVGNHLIAIHPGSVLFGKPKAPLILYDEFVYTNKAYAKGVSVAEWAWFEELV